MSRRDLTEKQRDFIRYLRAYYRDNGVWPTYREISDHFGFRSPNSVTQNLQALHKKGYLRRDEYGYELIESFSREAAAIPIRGTIAAGALQEAVEADLGSITLETIFPNLDRIFAIRVSGRSMVGEGIGDGDYVLLVDDDIPNGGIGAVLYDGETSLKRIYHEGNSIRLEAANEEYDDIRIEPDVFEEVTVLGRYVGHVNKDGIFSRAGRRGSRAA
ncbi:MAG: transcriptional repressor LexA [Rhodothermales bacterium]|nr:transcriptional repressor LexA [Rhodothermales bacterium]